MKVSAIANSNIALVKYWGKRDKEFMLPFNGSISMTVNDMFTHTTVEFDKKYTEDILIVNGKGLKPGEEDYDEYVGAFMKVVRQLTGNQTKIKIVSKNNYPTAAGLASSASGFAALSLAVSKAFGMPLNEKALSILARRGSGSASRSISAGFVEWHRGEKKDGSDSFAEQIAPPEHWPEFRMIAVITSKKEKKVKSRAGMAQTVATCPFYPKWVETVPIDLDAIRKGIKEKNFTLVGTTAEHNCLKMHATMIATRPAIIYWNPATMEVIHSIMDWRDEGLESYFTIDAGPQVKVLCMEKDSKELAKRLGALKGVDEIIVTRPGPGARFTDEHLF
ncbi:MAG: diphosphomevalonate decarboxylase [Candidatus Aenigmarchaeota archaeon]|nr:diphosphomevalonate decarboxylase [Candidatus Aenigmarchaeota archaeon]